MDTWRQILFGTPRERERAIDRLHESDRERAEFREFMRNPPAIAPRTGADIRRSLPGRRPTGGPPVRMRVPVTNQPEPDEPPPFPNMQPDPVYRAQLPDRFGPRPDEFATFAEYDRARRAFDNPVPALTRQPVEETPVDREPWRDPVTGEAAPARGLEPADAPAQAEPDFMQEWRAAESRAAVRWAEGKPTPYDMLFRVVFGDRGREERRDQELREAIRNR